MKDSTTPRVRRSIVALQQEYDQAAQAGKLGTTELESLMTAWAYIQQLPPDHPNSFFRLGGYHGEPFRGAGWGVSNSMFWGGYCNHGNVLFPTWHRVYCFQIEEALRTAPGCPNVTLPYWDETATYWNEVSGQYEIQGIPWALTREKVVVRGQEIDNPLRSFVLPVGITDNVSVDNFLYDKPKGYRTVRYPLSGLVGTAAARTITDAHNAQYPSPQQNAEILNQNVVGWLNDTVILPGGTPNFTYGILYEYTRCLDAPNYTVFSNTTSAMQWNEQYDPSYDPSSGNPAPPTSTLVVPLEQPHNDVHLAVGGYDVPQSLIPPSQASNYPDISAIAGANGDMGENDTAALDPIFYFHHCNVDRMFWLWQRLHHCDDAARTPCTDKLEIIPFYPGTNSSDNQGATPGIAPNAWLDLDTPLNPFYNKQQQRVYNSHDCVNIRRMGYEYSQGSLELLLTPAPAAPKASSKAALTTPAPTHSVLARAIQVASAPTAAPEVAASLGLLQKAHAANHPSRALHVSRVNKAPMKGSFIVAAYRHTASGEQLIGYQTVLNRWDSTFCANCQTHHEVKATFPLPAPAAGELLADSGDEAASYGVRVICRTVNQPQLAALAARSAKQPNGKPYKLEVKSKADAKVAVS